MNNVSRTFDRPSASAKIERGPGRDVSVVLHVLSGFVGELEIFAGEGVPVAAPHADSVTNIWIG